MKKFIPFILAVSLFAGCLGRRTPDSAADATVADFSIPEANAKPDPAGEGSDTGDWIYRNGGRKRWGPFVERDTTFLFVEEYPIGSDTNHYRVFIRRAPQPADNVNFTVLSPQNERDWNEFTSILRGIKKSHPEPLPRHAALKDLPRNWTPVRSFGGRYYVDGFAPYPVWISDSLFVRQFMDGPCPSPIEAAERISPTHYRLRTSAGYSGIDRVEIHIVDTVRKIAVFAFCYENNKTCFHALYAPFESGLGLDMVDFYSLERHADVVKWDEIDFEALIAGKASTSAGEAPEEYKIEEQ